MYDNVHTYPVESLLDKSILKVMEQLLLFINFFILYAACCIRNASGVSIGRIALFLSCAITT